MSKKRPDPNAFLNIRLTAKTPIETCGDSDSFRVAKSRGRFDSDLSLNNHVRRSCTEETIDDDLSDVQSIPSITVTNDDYFKWNQSRNQLNSASSTPAHFRPNGTGISRSDTMTTLHTVSSFPAANEQEADDGNVHNQSDDDGYETTARKARTSSSNSKVSTIIDVKLHECHNHRRSACKAGSNESASKRLSMASRNESPIHVRASPRVHESVVGKSSLASKSRPQLA